MDRRKLKIVLRIGISCLFIGYLLKKVDISALVSALSGTNLVLYLLSTLLAVLSSLFLACKYYLLIKDSVIKQSMLSLFKINFITRFYALFLPTAVGRDVVRWIKVTRNQYGRSLFLASIIFERLTFFFLLICFGSIPLFFYDSISRIAILRMRIMPISILSLAIASILISFFILPPIQSFIKKLIHIVFARRWKDLDIDAIIDDITLKNMKSSFYIYVFGLGLVWQLFFIGRLYALIAATALPLNVLDVAWMGSLVLLLQTIPISFAGIGIREGAYAYLFTLFGLPPEKGVVIGILFFFQMLIMAFAGGVLEFTGK
ncbi:MAG: flippase-like domain-containing protein [Desulfobacterales bacterium]|nr:MAG: flippase-like domain-containing protein [Desulfobacterales bacterium]